MTELSMAQTYSVPSRALGRAVAVALLGAAAIVACVVMPAEYGVDPTGIGTALGLTAMAGGGEEDEADTPAAVAAPGAAAAALAVPAQERANIEARAAWRSDNRTLTLAPHSGIELKAHMAAGDHLIFDWDASGPIRMDMHGEPKGGKDGEFTSYWKQKDMTHAAGAFTAPFEGTHGWYWRNGGETPVTVTLKSTGFYRDLFEPPSE